MLAGLVLAVWAFVDWENGGERRMAAGLVLAALGGLEVALREHLAGFRSHTTLLAGLCALVVATALLTAGLTLRLWQLGLLAAAVFAVCFWLFQRLFVRRSGGLRFR
ncbi:hypothetical protein [Thermoleophilum album]|uniref:hypothetical protein n=1 Tax=Thermoleophilum album TaxID=29539 RepID=UPI00115F939B|nr:hypothetical protein [Thermoleophilum album]